MLTRAHTIRQLVPPAITQVIDGSGTPLLNPDETDSAQLTLSGTAPASTLVIVIDNGAEPGYRVLVENGLWALELPMVLGRHSFTVQLPGEPPSQAWVITVTAAAVKPVITNIVDAQDEEIPPNQTTYDTRVTIKGNAQALGMVEIYDFALSKGAATADALGLWNRELVDLATGAHAIKARALYGNNPETAVRNFTVERQPLDLIAPQVLEAFGPNKDLLELARLADDTNVHVRVPHYTGMDYGQTVRVRWGGRVEYFTAIEPVERLAPIDFTIPRDEVIDSIGRLVDVNYSVVETPGSPLLPSKILPLTVLPQALNLVAPTINSGHTTVTVAYLGSLTSHTIVVRWRGITDRFTEIKHPPGNGSATTFSIPGQWVAENQGRRVLVTYSVGVGSNSLMFSQVLRINLP